jgi:hypothetical protein
MSQAKNRTNNKREEYQGKQLGHSVSAGNPDINQGRDARATPDTPNEPP